MFIDTPLVNFSDDEKLYSIDVVVGDDGTSDYKVTEFIEEESPFPASGLWEHQVYRPGLLLNKLHMPTLRYRNRLRKYSDPVEKHRLPDRGTLQLLIDRYRKRANDITRYRSIHLSIDQILGLPISGSSNLREVFDGMVTAYLEIYPRATDVFLKHDPESVDISIYFPLHDVRVGQRRYQHIAHIQTWSLAIDSYTSEDRDTHTLVDHTNEVGDYMFMYCGLDDDLYDELVGSDDVMHPHGSGLLTKICTDLDPTARNLVKEGKYKQAILDSIAAVAQVSSNYVVSTSSAWRTNHSCDHCEHKARKICKTCNGALCTFHSQRCGNCGRDYCSGHFREEVADSKFGSDFEIRICGNCAPDCEICYECGTVTDENRTCRACGNHVCWGCTQSCYDCSNAICSDCRVAISGVFVTQASREFVFCQDCGASKLEEISKRPAFAKCSSGFDCISRHTTVVDEWDSDRGHISSEHFRIDKRYKTGHASKCIWCEALEQIVDLDEWPMDEARETFGEFANRYAYRGEPPHPELGDFDPHDIRLWVIKFVESIFYEGFNLWNTAVIPKFEPRFDTDGSLRAWRPRAAGLLRRLETFWPWFENFWEEYLGTGVFNFEEQMTSMRSKADDFNRERAMHFEKLEAIKEKHDESSQMVA